MRVVNTRKPEGYTGTRNWDAPQPVVYSDLEGLRKYRSEASALSSQFGEQMLELGERLGTEVKLIGPDIKGFESAERKLYDRTSRVVGRPEYIGDYLRVRFEIPSAAHKGNGVGQLANAINTLIEHPNTVGFKDKYWRPDKETGHRAFYAKWALPGHNAEIQLDCECMAAANKLTEAVREWERYLRSIPDACNTGKLGRNTAVRYTINAEKLIPIARDLRKAVHDNAATMGGTNALMDPNLGKAYKQATEKDFEKLMRNVMKAHLARPYADRLVHMAQQLH